MDKKTRKNLNPVAVAISNLDFSGNVIPHQWLFCENLRRKDGLTNLPAVIVLADIVYWYRLVIIHDERTGVITGYRHKFAADKLQKYYGDWGRSLGLTERQTREAATFLKRGNFITIELRTIIVNGRKIGNVPFFEPVAHKIKEITQIPSHISTLEGVPPITPERDNPFTQQREYTKTTNTKITTTTRPASRGNVVVKTDELPLLEAMTQALQAAIAGTVLSDTDSCRVAQAMVRHGRTVEQAMEIVAMIAWTYHSRPEGIEDPTALLVAAGETGASRPAGYQSPQEREVRKAAAQKAAAQKKVTEQARAEQEQKRWNTAAEEFRNLSEAEKKRYMERYKWMSVKLREGAAIGAYMRSKKDLR